MDASIRAKSTVNEVLAAHPQTAMVFLALKASCVGCHLARFCRLQDVASAYELQVQVLVNKIRASIQFSPEE